MVLAHWLDRLASGLFKLAKRGGLERDESLGRDDATGTFPSCLRLNGWNTSSC